MGRWGLDSRGNVWARTHSLEPSCAHAHVLDIASTFGSPPFAPPKSTAHPRPPCVHEEGHIQSHLRARDLTRDWAAWPCPGSSALPSFVGLQFVERAEALAAQPDAIDRIGAVPNAFNEVSIERTSRIHVTRLQSGSGNAARFRFLIHTIAKFGAHKGRI